MTTTRTLAAVALPVPVMSRRRYAASYLDRPTCSAPGCIRSPEHPGTCLPAPDRDQRGAR